MEHKKHLIILILRILESETDKKHPITQRKICEEISRVFPCDRKTVGRNIKFLQEIKFPIIKTTKGFYMDNKQFSLYEISFILDLVKNSTDKNINIEDLHNRLYNLLIRNYKSE